MAEKELTDVVLASTVESPEELEFAANAGREERFTPPEKKDDAAGKEASGESTKVPKPGAAGEAAPSKGKEPEHVDKLTAELRREKEQRQDLERRLAALEGRRVSAPAAEKAGEEDPEPKREAFASDQEYADARARWLVRDENRKLLALKASTDEDARAKETFDAHLERLEAYKGKQADFVEKIEASEVQFTQEVGLAIIEMENGPEIMYHLATHPEEFKEVVALSPIRQVAAIGRISAALVPKGAAAPGKGTTATTKTPIPITAPKGSAAGAAPKALSEMDTDEFLKERGKQLARRK